MRVDAADAQVQLAQAAQRGHVKRCQLAVQRNQQAACGHLALQLRQQQAAAHAQLALCGHAFELALVMYLALQRKGRGVAQRQLPAQCAPGGTQLRELQLVLRILIAVAGLQAV